MNKKQKKKTGKRYIKRTKNREIKQTKNRKKQENRKWNGEQKNIEKVMIKNKQKRKT